MNKIVVLISLLFFAGTPLLIKAQSPDSRICNCMPGGGIDADFMLGTTAAFGTSNIALTRNAAIQPAEKQPMKFTIPVLTGKQGCTTTYSIVIYDAAGNKVYESSGRVNTIAYLFEECDKTYDVTVSASVSSAAGGNGNCSRQLHFLVKPKCNTTVCECFNDKRNPGAISGDLNVTGTFKCITPTATARLYLLKYDIVNKTDCILKVESITILGTSRDIPAYSILARQVKRGLSLGYTTPLTVAAPTDSKISISVKYSLNGRKCTVVMELPYVSC